MKILYIPFKSKNPKYKYSVYVKNENGNPKLIHFGDTKYQQYHDKLGIYSNLDHWDKERRRRYLARASKIRNGKGQLTANDKNSSNYYSIRYLW